MPASSIDGAREEGFHYKQHKHALGGGGTQEALQSKCAWLPTIFA